MCNRPSTDCRRHLCWAVVVIPFAVLTSTSFAGPAAPPLSEALAAALLADGQAAGILRATLLDSLPQHASPHSAAALRSWVEETRQRFRDEVLFRGWPEHMRRWKTRTKWLKKMETGSDYRIRKLLYEPLEGLWIPALLYEPLQLDGPVPAVLNVNGHVGELGKAIDYKQKRSIHLAQQGVLTLNAEWLGMGELRWKEYSHNRLAYLDLCGLTGVGVYQRVLEGAIDVLLEHEQTDPERVAVTGLSGGGWQSVFLASADARVKACAPNAGYIGLAVRVDNAGDIGDLEQIPFDLATVADYPQLTAMFFPRPALLIYNENDDCCFQSARAQPSVYAPVKPLYERFAPATEFSFHSNYDPGTHNYDENNRRAFYGFLARAFSWPPLTANEAIDPSAIRSFEELEVGLPPGNATFRSMALDAAKDLPRHRAASLRRDATSKRMVRRELRQLLSLEEESVVDAVTLVDTAALGLHGGRGYILHHGPWRLPLVELEPAPSTARDGTSVVLLVADDGRGSLAKPAAELRRQGHRVLVLDLLLTGERRPELAWQMAMLLRGAGKRPLGVTAGELLAVGAWARRRFGSPIELRGRGPVAGVAALLAGALDAARPGAWRRFTAVRAEESLHSLRQLITEESGLKYTRVPQLYCYGLLQVVDIPELIELAR